jgi:hypothetical protein
MRYWQIYQDISIVTVARFNCDICNPLNLYKHGVISLDEINSIDDKVMRVESDIVSFKTRSFELFCDMNRLQVRTEDCSRSDQLSDITLSILRLSEISPKAIGINATFRFGLDDLSFIAFSDRCLPLAAFRPMAKKALLSEVTFVDQDTDLENGQPRSVYCVKCLAKKINNHQLVQISVNNHLEMMDGINTAKYYLGETSTIHSLFFNKCRHFISDI